MSSDVERLLAGRVLALDRAAVPALAERVRALGSLDRAALDRQFAAVGDRATSLPITRSGSVAIVPLVGVITNDPFFAWLFGGTTPDQFAAAIRQAANEPDVSSILIVADSPGGEVGLLTETAADIRRVRAIKPIVAIARPMAASAAYWLISQAHTVVATPSADVGSIGVFALHYDVSALNERLGVKPTYIVSNISPQKVEANPNAPLGDDAKAFLQKRVDEAGAMFVADVALGRQTTEAAVRARYGGGRMFGAQESLTRGLVDKVATVETLIAGLATKNGRPVSRQAQLDRDLLETTLALMGGAGERVADEHAILAALADWPK